MELIANKTRMTEKEKIETFEKELYPHFDAVYNFLLGLTFDKTSADDLIQNTFLKAFKAIETYTRGTNAKAWLFTIARNEFINSYRKGQNRGKTVELEDFLAFHGEEDNGDSVYVDLSEEIYKNLMSDEVTNALQSLLPDEQLIVFLADIEDFKYDEIASILEVPIGTVRSRLNRTRNKLKKILADYGRSHGYRDKRK
ncbi:MAG: sigma-70 family RNA polymerase sigma factor [Bacteroidetes bacterium]|nr:MAG: sigma-70 family RNA polymerase sigma factor [Bacteroidota bacterium]